MRWQRPARFIVAGVGVSCAVAIVALSRDRRPAPPPDSGPRKEPTATSEQANLSSIRFNLKGLEYTLDAKHSATFADGSSRYEAIHLSANLRDGRKFELWADTAEEKGQAAKGDNPAEITVNGHVRVEMSDGLHFETNAATLNDNTGLVEIPGALSFKRERLSGQGVGGTYDRDRDVMQIRDQAHVIMGPDATGAGAVDATSKSMLLDRAQHFIQMDAGARLVRPEETLSADSAVVRFTPDEQGVQLLELHGHASVIPGAVENPPPEMHADDITLGFHPDGQTLQRANLARNATLALTKDKLTRTISGETVNLMLAADGKTATHLDAQNQVVVTLPASKDAPGRVIKAPSLVAQGDEKNGLQTAVFDGGVNFDETKPASAGQPASTRTATSRSLALRLKGDLDAIEQADFSRDVTFRDGTTTATADVAEYRSGKGELTLRDTTATPRSRPTVDDGNVNVEADVIDLATESHDLRAKGAVRTLMKQSPAPDAKKRSPGLFDDQQPVSGTSKEFQYVNEGGKATYTGEAKVVQGQNRVFGDVVILERDSSNLHATGHVTSVFLLDDQPGPRGAKDAARQTTSNTATAAKMDYLDAHRKATYLGDDAGQATLKGPDGEIHADRIDLFLAKEQRSLESLVATRTSREVHATLEGQREALGDRLTYDAATEQYVLTGKPAYVKYPRNDGPGCARAAYRQITFWRANRTPEMPRDEGPPGTMVNWPCDQPIK